MFDHLRDAVDRYLDTWGHGALMRHDEEREMRGR